MCREPTPPFSGRRSYVSGVTNALRDAQLDRSEEATHHFGGWRPVLRRTAVVQAFELAVEQVMSANTATRTGCRLSPARLNIDYTVSLGEFQNIVTLDGRRTDRAGWRLR